MLNLKELGQKYGFDISRPATNFKEAVQWLYLAYLAVVLIILHVNESHLQTFQWTLC
jgi:pyruvate-formate lyase